MKNLKKVLSLVLALAMAFSLMTVAFAADASDFTDYDEITYTEAVDVMTAAGVFNGYDDGSSFDPTGTLTREQAAKIITYMLVGQDQADRLTTTIAPYSDVSADRWSAGAIAYCTNEGIIAGTGSGTFEPTRAVTGLEFAKMLLVALGYDATIQSLEGSSWAINTATLALGEPALDTELEDLSLSDDLTREQAAQMAFNAEKADLVRYENKGTNINLGDGTTVVIGATPATNYANDSYGAGSDIFGDSNVAQFAERYCQDLDYTAEDADDFGRPAHAWDYDGTDVGTYGDEAVVTFTKAMEADDVARALRDYVLVNDNNTPGNTSDDTTYKINNSTEYPNSTALTHADSGKIVHVNNYDDSGRDVNLATDEANQTVAERLAKSTGNGRLMEFYANDDNEITAIVLVGHGVSQVDRISTNNDGDVTYKLDGLSNAVNYADEDKDDTVSIQGSIAEDDIVTYVICNGVTYIYPTTTVVGTQTAYNTNKATITVSGTTYDVATYTYDKINNQQVDVDGTNDKFPNGDEDANYYMDQFGLAVYSDAIASDTEYVVMNKLATVAGLSDTVKAELIFPDGSRQEVTVDSIKTEAGVAVTMNSTNIPTSSADPKNVAHCGIVYTYDINSDGEYELTAVPTSTGESANAASCVINVSATVMAKGDPIVKVDSSNTITTNNNTIFVVKSPDSNGDPEYNSYTGFKAIPTITADSDNAVKVDYAKKDNSNGAVEYVYIDAMDAAGVSSTSDSGDIVLILNTDKTTSTVDNKDTFYYEAIINGEQGLFASDDDALTTTLYKVTDVNEDGVATGVVAQVDGDFALNDNYKAFASLTQADCTDAADGVVVINNVTYTYDGSETVYIVNDDGDVMEGEVDDLALNTNTSDYKAIFVKEVDNNTSANEIDTMYVVLN